MSKDADSHIAPGSHRRAGPLGLLLLLLLLGALALVLLLLTRDAPRSAPDAAIVARASLDAAPSSPPPDATRTPSSASPDASPTAPPPDAGPRTPPPRRDAGPRAPAPPVDAAPTPTPTPPAPAPDAAPAPAATEHGYLKLIAEPFATIRIDGIGHGSTPKYKLRLPAGPHDVELISPDSGEVRLRRTVTIVPGQTVSISIP